MVSGKRTQFDIDTATAAAFLTLLASEQTVRAAQAAVDRSQVLARSVTALVNAQLRPGADLSRANTELDAAETQLIQGDDRSMSQEPQWRDIPAWIQNPFQAVSGPAPCSFPLKTELPNGRRRGKPGRTGTKTPWFKNRRLG